MNLGKNEPDPVRLLFAIVKFLSYFIEDRVLCLIKSIETEDITPSPRFYEGSRRYQRGNVMNYAAQGRGGQGHISFKRVSVARDTTRMGILWPWDSLITQVNSLDRDKGLSAVRCLYWISSKGSGYPAYTYSSSGCGTGLSAGFFDICIATDTSGSIRNPCLMNSLACIKPSRHVIDRNGVWPFSQSLDTVGVMARHSVDLASVMQAYEPYIDYETILHMGFLLAERGPLGVLIFGEDLE